MVVMHIHRKILGITSAVALAATALLGGQMATAATKTRAATATTAPITFTYWGDSITARTDSWWYVMQDDARFQSVGGYAHSGYRSDQVLPYARAYGADVTVIELGTNDINQGVPNATVENNIAAIVKAVSGQHVLIVAAPPSDVRSGGCCDTDRTVAGFELNKDMSTFAANKGWMFADPFQFVREYDNTYAPGTDADGVHPTADTNLRVEKLMGLFIQQAVGGSKP